MNICNTNNISINIISKLNQYKLFKYLSNIIGYVLTILHYQKCVPTNIVLLKLLQIILREHFIVKCVNYYDKMKKQYYKLFLNRLVNWYILDELLSLIVEMKEYCVINENLNIVSEQIIFECINQLHNKYSSFIYNLWYILLLYSI